MRNEYGDGSDSHVDCVHGSHCVVLNLMRDCPRGCPQIYRSAVIPGLTTSRSNPASASTRLSANGTQRVAYTSRTDLAPQAYRLLAPD